MTMGVAVADAAPAVDTKPQYYTVFDSLTGNRPHFRSVSEKRAREWVEKRAPRGSHVYLAYPNGETWAYEAERTGAKGIDVDQWQPFDPSTYTRPEQGGLLPPDEWADVEA